MHEWRQLLGRRGRSGRRPMSVWKCDKCGTHVNSQSLPHSEMTIKVWCKRDFDGDVYIQYTCHEYIANKVMEG